MSSAVEQLSRVYKGNDSYLKRMCSLPSLLESKIMRCCSRDMKVFLLDTMVDVKQYVLARRGASDEYSSVVELSAILYTLLCV